MGRRDKRQPVPDRHRLYELAVQCPEADVEFFDRIYRERNGRLPELLREDFCGTASLAAEWVRTRPSNRAIGVDMDAEVLDWGQRHNIEPLGSQADRVELIHGDVRSIQDPPADVLAALN
ncbi:MAG: class I SAM-dependent methyltransferase, partial [Candidatus Eisenbacteria bacterium]|nr:class I SAM-dependent methyltransferase [Candidatus Eisenbacteria bacterium]